MATPDLPRQRLLNQQLTRPRFSTAGQLVTWMGAVQAQDYLGSLWAVGQRLRSASEPDIEEAIAARTIVRTWPMRGTLHFAPGADVRWMLRLLTPRVIARSAGRYRQLELDDAALTRSRRILVRVLEGGRRLTRGAAYAALEAGGVSPAGQRGIHILAQLAQEGVVCFGPREGRQATFVLLDEWLPPTAEPTRDEALAMLARRYFDSHRPATRQDFAWWSGLLVKDAQRAMDAAGPTLEPDARDGVRSRTPVAALLPPWDEYLVAYKDRAAAVAPIVAKRNPLAVVGSPVIVIDGRVRGSWGRTLEPSTVRVRVDYWTRVTREERRAVAQAAVRYARFLGREAWDAEGPLRA